MNLSDLPHPPSGEIDISVFENGVLVERWIDKNLIVDNSKNIHAKLLGGAPDLTNQFVRRIAFGTDGAPPEPGDTVITAAYTKDLSFVSYPASNQVQFGFSLGAAENNGVDIMEFGLITAGGRLYARKARTLPLSKNISVSLTGTWTIIF